MRAGLSLRSRSNRSSPATTPTLANDTFADNIIVSNPNLEQSSSRTQDHYSDVSNLSSPMLPSVPNMSPIIFDATPNNTEEPSLVDEVVDLRETANRVVVTAEPTEHNGFDTFVAATPDQLVEEETCATPKTPELMQSEAMANSQTLITTDSEGLCDDDFMVSKNNSEKNNGSLSEPIFTSSTRNEKDHLLASKLGSVNQNSKPDTSNESSGIVNFQNTIEKCSAEPSINEPTVNTGEMMSGTNEYNINTTLLVEPNSESSLKPSFEENINSSADSTIYEAHEQQKHELNTGNPEIQFTFTEKPKNSERVPGSNLLGSETVPSKTNELDDLSPNTSLVEPDLKSKPIDITNHQILPNNLDDFGLTAFPEMGLQHQQPPNPETPAVPPSTQQKKSELPSSSSSFTTSSKNTTELPVPVSPKFINKSPSSPRSSCNRYSVSTPKTPRRTEVIKHSPMAVLSPAMSSQSPKGSFLATRQQVEFPFKTSASVNDLQDSNLLGTTSSPFLSARSPSSLSRPRAGRVGFVQSAMLRSRAGSIDCGDMPSNSLLARSISRASHSSSPTKKNGHARAQSTNSVIYNYQFSKGVSPNSVDSSPNLNSKSSHLNLHSSAIAKLDLNEGRNETSSHSLQNHHSNTDEMRKPENVISKDSENSLNIKISETNLLRENADPKDFSENLADARVEIPESSETSESKRDNFGDLSGKSEEQLANDKEPCPGKTSDSRKLEITGDDSKIDCFQAEKLPKNVTEKITRPTVEKKITRKSTESVTLEPPTLGAKFELRPASPTRGLLASPFRSSVQLSPESSPTRGGESPKGSHMPRWGSRGRSTWLESALMKNPGSPGLDRSQSSLQRSPNGKSTANFPRGKVPLPAPLTYNRPPSPTKMLGNIRNFAGDLDRSPSRIGRNSEPDIRPFLPERPASPTKTKEPVTNDLPETQEHSVSSMNNLKEASSTVESTSSKPIKKNSDFLKSSASLKARVVSPSTAFILNRSNTLRPVPAKKQEKAPVPEALEILRQLRSGVQNKYHSPREDTNTTVPDWKSNLKRSSTVQYEPTDTMKETILGARNSLRPSSSLSVHSTDTGNDGTFKLKRGSCEKPEQEYDVTTTDNNVSDVESSKDVVLEAALNVDELSNPVKGDSLESYNEKESLSTDSFSIVAESSHEDTIIVKEKEEDTFVAAAGESVESDFEEKGRDSPFEEIGSASSDSYVNMSPSERDSSANGGYDDDYYSRSLTPPPRYAMRDEIEISDSEDEDSEIIYTPPRSIPKPIRGGGRAVPIVRGLNDDV